MCITTIKLLTEIKEFGKFASFKFHGMMIFCSTMVLDEEWLHEAGALSLLLDLSVLLL